MTHKIKQSLAGTRMQYFVVEGNEGFRMRKLGEDRVRIHIETDAPEINSRSRLDDYYKVKYNAVDMNLSGLKEQVGLVENGRKFIGIETALATLTVKEDALAAKGKELRVRVAELEKEAKALADEKKELSVLKGKVARGMQAYHEALQVIK